MSDDRDMTPDNPHAHLCGWLDLPGRHAVAATFPTLAQAGPDLAPDPSKTILLYRCWKAVFSGDPDYPAQEIGDCVSFGHAHAHDLLQTVEAYLGDLPVASIHRTATEFVYGESRKVSNNLGWGDGSYGAAAIKAMTTVGMVSYAELAEANEATSYTGQRAKQWGRTGPPSAVETIAARHKLGAGVLLNSTDDMMASLQAGHPCSICSGQGFTMERDSDGFCRASGHWGHCMFVAGYRADKPGFLICQSWGPKTPSGPLALDQPSFSFWCDMRTMGHIISEGDSFALSDTPGLSPRPLPSELSAA